MKCPDCGDEHALNNVLEVVCRNCGLVIEENKIVFDQSSFDQNKMMEHPQLAQAGGQQVSGKIYKKSWFQTRCERNLSYVERELDLILPKLGLPHSIKKDSLILFKRVNESKFLKFGSVICQLIQFVMVQKCLSVTCYDSNRVFQKVIWLQ